MLWPKGDSSPDSSVIPFSVFKPQIVKSHFPISWCHFLLRAIFLMCLQIYKCILGTLITHITNGMPSKADFNVTNKALLFSFASLFFLVLSWYPLPLCGSGSLWSVKVHYKPDLLSDPIYLLSSAIVIGWLSDQSNRMSHRSPETWIPSPIHFLLILQ